MRSVTAHRMILDMTETLAPEPQAKTISPPPRRGYRWGRIALALAIAAALIVGWQYFENLAPSTLKSNDKAAPSGPPPQTVRVAEAGPGDMPIVIDALGSVVPLASVTVKTQISGKLMQVGFQEGQMVKEGDFLAQIDSRPFEATLAQAEGQLAKDTSLYQQALNDLARYQTLSKQDSIAHQQVDNQAFLVAQDKAAMATDQAQIDAAKLNISYTRILAPITGRVGFRLVDAGNYVQPSDSGGLVVITKLDPISVIFSTPEDNLPRITRRLNAGAKLPVTVLDRSNVKQLAVGELTTFDNQVDTTTGTFKLRATFANPENVLFPNQFVNARLLVDTQTGVIVVPNAAVQLGQDGAFVYVVKDDSTVSIRKVTTGPSDTSRTVISSGLKAGEKVVIDGADRLREGSAVKIAQARTDAGANGAGVGDASAQGKHKRKQGQEAPGADSPAPTPASPSPSPSVKP